MRYLVSRRMRTNLAHVSPICICMNRRGLRDWNKFGRLSELCNLYRLTNDGRVHSILGLRYVRKIATFALFSIIEYSQKCENHYRSTTYLQLYLLSMDRNSEDQTFKLSSRIQIVLEKSKKISRPTISRRFPLDLSHTLAPIGFNVNRL